MGPSSLQQLQLNYSTRLYVLSNLWEGWKIKHGLQLCLTFEVTGHPVTPVAYAGVSLHKQPVVFSAGLYLFIHQNISNNLKGF